MIRVIWGDAKYEGCIQENRHLFWLFTLLPIHSLKNEDDLKNGDYLLDKEDLMYNNIETEAQIVLV